MRPHGCRSGVDSSTFVTEISDFLRFLFKKRRAWIRFPEKKILQSNFVCKIPKKVRRKSMKNQCKGAAPPPYLYLSRRFELRDTRQKIVPKKFVMRTEGERIFYLAKMFVDFQTAEFLPTARQCLNKGEIEICIGIICAKKE